MDVALTENDKGESIPVGRQQRPFAYTSFSPKLAPSLAVLGSVLAVLGGLGAWIRVTEAGTTSNSAQLLRTSMGFRNSSGIVIGVVGAIAAFAWVWARRRPFFATAAASALAVTTAVLATIRFVALTHVSAQDAARARVLPNPTFSVYHSALGWGTWLLLIGAVILAIAVVAFAARELDVRREKT